MTPRRGPRHAQQVASHRDAASHLPIVAGPRRNAARGVAAAFAWLAACSALPEPHFPSHAEHDVEAEFVIASDGRLVLPQSSRDLVVHELRLDPPPLNVRFDDGERWFAYEPGTRVVVRSRFRTYGSGGLPPALASDALPGAVRVRAAAVLRARDDVAQ